MNNQFVMTVVCSECGEKFVHDNKNSQQLQGEEMYFDVEFNFKSGKIEFVCPNCNKLNTMEFISNSNLNKYAKLPGIAVWR